MSAVMTNDENAKGVADYSEKKMIRKAMKVDSANIAFANCERLRSSSCFSHELPQLGIEVICQFRCGHFLVVGHDAINIRVNFRMKDEPH